MGRGLTAAGLVLSLFGVLLLFRYGMPYRIENHGTFLIGADVAPDRARSLLATDRRYKILGWIGLSLTVVGTLIQILALFVP
jgi:hypothetical protein